MDNQQLSSEEEKVQRLSQLRVHLNPNQVNLETGDTFRHKIYVLICPITYTIKYVGRTVKSNINERLNEHIQESKRKNYRLCTWIRKLSKLNIKPIILEVAKYDETVINEAEIEWIKILRKQFTLKNHLDGGKQGFGYKHSMERKLKISRALKGRPKSAEAVQKLRVLFSKTVYKYTLQGNLLATYTSATVVESMFNYAKSSINKACRKNGTAYGYAWRYYYIPKDEFVQFDKRFKNNIKIRYTKGKDIVRT